MRNLGWTFVVALLGTVAVGHFALSASTASSLFDKPLKTVRVPLPRDPDNPQSKAELSCAYYPRFVVKQIDLGEEGAYQLSIIPLSGQEQPACRKDNATNEKVVSADDWTGYFDGVKGNYVFFDAEDGWNDGMGFAVFTPEAKKIYDDVAKKWSSAEVTPTGVALRYERVFGAKCSLQVDQATCWSQIKQATGLADATPPDCRAAYVKEQNRVPKFAKQTLSDPTIIDYDVSVTIDGTTQKTKAVTGKALRCRPAE